MEKHYSDEYIYTFEADAMRKLESIRVALYGNGRALTPDERRDLANLLDSTMNRVTRTVARF